MATKTKAKTPKPRTMRVWVVMLVTKRGDGVPVDVFPTRIQGRNYCDQIEKRNDSSWWYVVLPFTGQMPKGKVRR